MTIKTSSMRTGKPGVTDKSLLQVLPAEVDEFALDLVRLLKRAGVWEALPKRPAPSPEAAGTTPRHRLARQAQPARRLSDHREPMPLRPRTPVGRSYLRSTPR